MARRPALILGVIATAGSALTVAVSLSPSLRFAYHSPSMHIGLETAAALIAVFAALLVAGRARLGRTLGDVLLATGLALFAVANLVFAAAPRVLEAANEPALTTWAPLATRVEAATLFALAALLPPIRLRRLSATAVGAAVLAVVSLVAAGTAALALGDRLPIAVASDISPERSSSILIAGHPILLAAQVVVAIAFCGAALGFARQAALGGSPLLFWLAPAAALLALARVNYLLFPSLYSEWVYTGDVFRLAGYLSILVGGALELRGYWTQLAGAAVLEERRRLARDLHDGVAQELAFIVREAAGTLPRAELASAAQRGLDEARRALAALTDSVDEPLETAIGQAAEEMAARAGGRVRLELDSGVHVPQPTREALVRIVREAVTNALRHGGAATVVVELSGTRPLRLRVADDGAGFDTEHPRRGHGLTSMRERAEQVGAAFSIVSGARVGTEVTVVLP